LESVAKTCVFPAVGVAIKKRPLAQIQATYSNGALSNAADAQWTFLAWL
jgi:hypothetical protein